jgi:NAD+ synthase
MLRDWEYEEKERTEWIKRRLEEANVKGVVIGISGGKDCAVVAALLKKAIPNVLGVMMSCGYISPEDKEHALLLARKFDIKLIEIDLTNTYEQLSYVIGRISETACTNIKPRLRMTTLYAIAQTNGYLVAGTSNLSEYMMGYFTKWGDGGYDFNPIADLTCTEVIDYGRYLGVPEEILSKPPSAGLWPGQTDEGEMGLTYKEIDNYLKFGNVTPEVLQKINEARSRTQHKRTGPHMYAPLSD